MKILILGLNYAPEKIGIAIYTTGMAEALVRMGHAVQVVAGQPYYPAWQITEGFPRFRYTRGLENGVDITRVPHYVPGDPTGPKRLLHHLSFAATALFPTLARAISTRPDVVMTIAPSLAAAPVARLAASLVGAQAWLHIQDFEVEAALATGLFNSAGGAARWGARFEALVIRRFDRVSAIAPQMCARLAAKGVSPDRIVEFRNWVDIGAIRPLTNPSPYRAEWGITTPHVALYSGNIANKQGIEIVIDAARHLSHRQDLTFVICGEGPNRAGLERRAQNLANIQFHDLQPAERLNDLAGLATIHLLPQRAGVADLVLPSKLTTMLASGRPIVATAMPGTGLAEEVEGCGLVTPPEDAATFAAAIQTLMDDPALHACFTAAARQRAEERWSANVLTRLDRLLGDMDPPADLVPSKA